MKNNNKAIITKITTRSLSSDKKRNFFIVTAIMLTTFMIASVFSIGFSFLDTLKKQQIALMGMTAHAGMTFPTQNQLEKLANLSYIKEYGTGNAVGKVLLPPEMGDVSLSLFTFDKTAWETMRLPALDDVVGNYPTQENEIMFPKWVLDKMGIDSPEIGMPIEINYVIRNGDSQTEYTETFFLSGYFTSYMYIRLGNMDTLMVSKALSDKYGKSPEIDGSVTFIFDNPQKTLEYCELLKTELEISEKQDVRPIPMYDQSGSDQAAGLIAVGLIALFLMFTGYLLIYNVMFISVSRDIRFYGMLKTVGTTPKQLRSIVIGQVFRLCLIGIPIGVLLAGAVSLCLVPAVINGISNVEVKTHVSFSPIIYLGAAILSLLTAVIGAAKPAKKAASISPIEAVRFSGADIKGLRTLGDTHARLYKMAYRNVFRDKKRAVIVLLSLVISMTTFITTTTLVTSMDTDNFIATYVKSDFELSNNTAFYFSGETKQKFTGEFLERLESVPGFESMEIRSEAFVYMSYTDEFEDYVKQVLGKEPTAEERLNIESGFTSIITGIDVSALAKLNESLDEPFDLDAFESGEYVLLVNNNQELLEHINSITITDYERKKSLNLSIGGFVPRYKFNNTSSFGPTIICSNTLMKEFLDEPIVKNVFINVKKGFDTQALETIKIMTDGDNEISRTSRIEMREEMRNSKILLYALGGGISLIIGLIGIMNFVNVMSVGIMVRKRELAALESVGMSKKQMRKMLIWEGVWYALLTLGFVATIGNLGAYGMFTLFRQQADYAIFTYPIIPAIITSVIIALLCVITPEAAYRSISRLSLVERLREAE